MMFSARLFLFACLLALPASAAPLPENVQFNAHVRPILSDKCFACHGPDKNTREADLRLDLFEAATAPLKDSAARAVVPGKPGESVMLQRIDTKDPDDVMPPPSSHKAIKPEERALLEKWIAQGAVYEPHWSYTPLVRPAVPQPRHASAVINPIDAFILARLETAGLEPSPDADAATLIRRLSLDLTGLPPSPAQTAAFAAAAAKDLTSAVRDEVKRLVGSPAYGERMAVLWLDAVRYADTVGIHGDQGQRIWPYRDYVINAFRTNKPYDQFVTEQLAGDLLPDPTDEQLIATGFTRLNQMTREGGAQPKEYLAKYAADRVRAVGTAFLGQTTGCAQCHDHKFDPISTHDFYAMSAFFADIRQWGVYQDYGYTPNPDLRGWNNDKPWPPEIVAKLPSQLERIRQLQEAMMNVLGAEPADRRPGLLGDFLTNYPDGWQVLTPLNVESSGKTGSRLNEDGSVTLLGGPEKGNVITVRLPRGLMNTAAFRIEVSPDPEHGGKTGRSSAGNFTLTAKFQSVVPGKPPRDLKVRWAQADLEEETDFFNGDTSSSSLGKAWKSAPGRWEYPKTLNAQTQTAVYSLQRPDFSVKDGELIAVIETADAARLRFSVSPFPDPVPGLPAAPAGVAEALRAQKPDARQTSLVNAALRLVWTEPAKMPPAYQNLLTQQRDCRAGWARSMIAVPVPEKDILVTRVLPRGNWQDESHPALEPAVFHFLPSGALPKDRRLTRLDLARWITAPENPLAARHFVNRLWKQFFGTGLSGVLDDLGGQGEWPSHPELLDWLAAEFRDSGWNVAHMVELLVTSRTWRQQSAQRKDLALIDPGNRLLAEQSARRLDAEFVRDNALAVSGLLQPEIPGGPSAYPWQPAGYYEPLNFPQREYPEQHDSRQYRRGLYMHWQRSFLHPMLANFDAPSREECAGDRLQANSPQQALTLLNDPSFVEASRAFAARLLEETADDPVARIDHAFHLALARPASDRERQSLTTFLETQRANFRGGSDDPQKFLGIGIYRAPAALDPVELAAWTQVCRVILNLHETITRY